MSCGWRSPIETTQSLNWTPCPGCEFGGDDHHTHTLGSEAETLRAVAGVPHSRNENAEFKMGNQSQADLLDQIRQGQLPP